MKVSNAFSEVTAGIINCELSHILEGTAKVQCITSKRLGAEQIKYLRQQNLCV